MRICQINCVYGKGSTGQIVENLHTAYLAMGHASQVLYGRGDASRAPNIHKVCTEAYAKANRLLASIRGIPYGGCRLSTRRIIRHIEMTKPDIVHLHCINGSFVNIYRLIAHLNAARIPTILTLHAEFMYTGGCSHALSCLAWQNSCTSCSHPRRATGAYIFGRPAAAFQRMQHAFSGFGRRIAVASVSPWLRQRAEQSTILRGMAHLVVLNGIATETIYPPAVNTLRKQLGLGSEKLLLHVVPIFPSKLKGSAHLLALAHMLLEDGIHIAVVGDIRNVRQVSAYPRNLHFLGHIENRAQLAGYYAAADATILTSAVETFSMVCAESAIHGTPVAGFACGGPESILPAPLGTFVPQGDVHALRSAILSLLACGYDRAGIRRIAASLFSGDRMSRAYLSLYASLLEEEAYL